MLKRRGLNPTHPRPDKLCFANPDVSIEEKSIEAFGGGFMSQRDGNGIASFLVGLGIGAVVGVLFAPQSGSETREVLLSKAGEGKEFVRNRARDAREQASEWVDRGKDVLNQQKDQMRSAVEAGKQAYRQTTTAAADDGAKNL
jgi:gas vesicle protein